MSPVKKDATQLAIGAEPRIDFLPLEIKQRKQNRRARRSLVLLVIAVVGVCIVGYVASAGLAVSSQAALDASRAKTAQLLAEQGKYIEAQSVAADRDTALNAAKVGSANEILWKGYLAELVKALPADTDVEQLSVDSLAAGELAAVSTIQLERPRVATITFTVTTGSLDRASQIVERLKGLRGFADATITAIAKAPDEPLTASVVLHVDSTAFERRLLTPIPDDAAANTTEDQG